MSISNDVDELLEEIEDALEMDGAVGPPEVPTTDSLPDLPHDLQSKFFEHTYLADRIRLDSVWPQRFTRHTHNYFRQHIGKFTIDPENFKRYTGRNHFTEQLFVDAVSLIMPVLGQYVTNLSLNYTNLKQWPTVPAIVGAAAKEHCRSLIKLQIFGISRFTNDPKVYELPDMSTLESFVYVDSEVPVNQDQHIKSYLSQCSNNLESLTINHSYLNGSCLSVPKNLRFLQLQANLTSIDKSSEDSDVKIRPVDFKIGKLTSYCLESTVRHLELQQVGLDQSDTDALLSMKHLSYLVLKITHGSTAEGMNIFLQAFARKDSLYHLELNGCCETEYELSDQTLSMLNDCRRLRRLQLGGVAQTENFVRAMGALVARSVLVYYSNMHGNGEAEEDADSN